MKISRHIQKSRFKSDNPIAEAKEEARAICAPYFDYIDKQDRKRDGAKMNVRCEDCRWWDNSTQRLDAAPDTTGLCRATTPVADERDGRARWAFTEDTDWCICWEEKRP
jgi:hypothetical protein